MKKLAASVLMWAAVGVSLAGQAQTPPAQEPAPQGPTFRTGVDLIEVDVAVVDQKGQPVENLLPPDFLVKIDGQPRRVVSAEHVRIDVEAARREAADPFESLYTTNLKPMNGRQIVLAVDQLGIRFGAARPLLATAGKVSRPSQPCRPRGVRRLPRARRSGRVHGRLSAHQARDGAGGRTAVSVSRQVQHRDVRGRRDHGEGRRAGSSRKW